MSLLKIQDLSLKTYPPGKTDVVTILKNINLDIKKNKITALIGESGAGKSMLAKTISALLPKHIYVSSGRFFYEDREVDARWLKKVRGREIFYTPQNAAASFNPVLKLRGMAAPNHQKTIDVLKRLNIDDPLKLLNSYAFELSEGENQRALLALAAVQNPRLLILDEPVSALDASNRRDFMKLFKTIRSSIDSGILLITHDLRLVRHIADFVYIILDGEIVEAGTTVSIFQKPIHPYTREITHLVCW